MKSAYVYSLICPISNKIKYIGQTRQKLYKRLYKHLREINKNKSHKNNWLKILEKQNILHKLRIEIIEECAFDKLNEREIYWIKFYKNKGLNLTNMTTGGECGSLGYKHTDEAKRKIAERNKLPKHETSLQGRENISKSLIGNKRRLGKKH
jgi:hypothetical protein